MIERIYGTPIDYDTTSVVLNLNNGLCVRVLTPSPGNYAGDVLSEDPVDLHTVLLIRGVQAGDGSFVCYGFESRPMRDMFNLLRSVQGVGPKAALALCEKGLDELVAHITHDEPDGLKVKGVGPKTTKKIVLALKGKVEKIFGSVR